MGSVVTGLKAGVIAGIFYGAIDGIAVYLTSLSFKDTIISALQNALPSISPSMVQQAYQLSLTLAPILAFVDGIILGLLFGAIYGWVVERIPGRSYFIKGLFLGFMLWFVLSVLTLAVPRSVPGLQYFQYGPADYLAGVAAAFVPAMVFGSILGYLYGRFLPKQEFATIQSPAP